MYPARVFAVVRIPRRIDASTECIGRVSTRDLTSLMIKAVIETFLQSTQIGRKKPIIIITTIARMLYLARWLSKC